MFCGKCGTSLPEGTKFCHTCGWQIPQPSIHTNQPIVESPKNKSERLLKCPKCGSEHIQFATSTETKGFSVGSSCCGYILLGPLGLLCGLCGAGESKTKDFWVCHNCGAKFQAEDALKTLRQRHEKLAEYRSLLQDAPENLEYQCAVIWQETQDTARLLGKGKKKLRAEYPQYAAMWYCTPIGIGMVLLGLVLTIFNSPYAIPLFLLGLVLIVVATNIESKMFDTYASPELKQLSEKTQNLIAQNGKMQKQLQAKRKKQKIESELH